MRMRQSFFALFMAVILLLPTYVAFADETLPDFMDGGDTVAEQSNEQSGDGVIQENETLPDTDDAGQDGDIGFRSANISLTDYVGSQEEFEEWIADHTDKSNNFTGGSVTLGEKVILKRHILLSGSLYIDTGAYGLTMDGGSVSAGIFSITGEGVNVPVLTIVNMGLWSATWDSILPVYNVTARGRDGIGGVAVRVSTDMDGSPGILESQGHIRSKGEGAVGVKFDYPVEANLLSVSAEGKNSVAVDAPEGASLYYCKLESSGEGSKIVSDSNILLDTCAISGDASHADVVSRKIVALAGSSLYWPLAQGKAIRGSYLYNTFYNNTVPLYFLLSGNETHPEEVRITPIQWDRDKMDGVDTSIVKENIISGKLYDHYQGLGLEGDFSLDLTIDVVESGNPCIVSLKFSGFYDNNDNYVPYVYFQTNDLYENWFETKDGNFILWRSDGDGEDWYNFTDSPDVSLADGGIIYYYDKITAPVWFRIQEVDGECSNIAVIYGYEGKTCGSLGGDRTGADRGGENSVTAPTPTPDPGSTPRSTSASSSSSQSLPNTPSDTAVQATAELTSWLSSGNPSSGEENSADTDMSSSVSTLPNEWENDTTTAISGRRLRMMMNAGDKVTFIKKELRLSFDTSALDALEIGDSQLFSVAAVHLGRLEYKVTATLDGTDLCELPCVATLDGNRRYILVSGTYDFTPAANEPDTGQTQTLSAVTQPFREQGYGETINSLTDEEEKPSARRATVFALLGAGGVVGVVVLVRSRVKRYGP